MNRSLSRASLWSGIVLATLASAGNLARAELVVDPQDESGVVTSADSPAAAPVAAPVVQQVAVPAQAYPIQQMAPVQPIVIAAPAAAPVAAAAPAVDPADKMSRTDLVRRERMREELRNEDILQERLEELRLQDEKRRTGQVLGVAPEAAPASGALLASVAAPAAVIAAPVTEQVVSVPVTDRPGSASSLSGTTVSAVTDSSEDETTTLRLAPRGGMSGFSGQNPYALQGRYSLGAGVDVGVSDHLSFEIGYTFSEYGVALNSATALGLAPILGAGGYGFNYNQNNTTGVLRQNVVDAGIKLHLLGRRSKLRPYIGGGAGYSRSYLNYDSRIVDFLRNAGYGVSPDYDMTQFLANASAGVELQLSKSVVVGLSYKYYTVLSSRQNQELYNPALYGAYPGALYGGYGGFAGAGSLADLDKQYVGGSLATTSFYSVLGTVSFSF